MCPLVVPMSGACLCDWTNTYGASPPPTHIQLGLENHSTWENLVYEPSCSASFQQKYCRDVHIANRKMKWQNGPILWVNVHRGTYVCWENTDMGGRGEQGPLAEGFPGQEGEHYVANSPLQIYTLLWLFCPQLALLSQSSWGNNY